MEEKLKHKFLPVIEAEYIMARFWNGMLNRTEAVRLLEETHQRAAAGKHGLTDLDEAEFKRFASILSRSGEDN
jgi:hypothetical protein